MGNTSWLPADDEVALVECGEEHSVEVNRPHAVVGLLQADVLMDQGVRDVHEPLTRNVPASVTRFTRKWPGYSGTGSRSGYGRREGR